MNILSKKVLFVVFLALFVNLTTLHAQSENEKIENLVAQKRAFNKTHKSSVVYKIQLYNGSESRAYQIRSNFMSSFPEYSVKVIYKAPEWKTQVIYFNNRLEADRALNRIKEKFAGAIVLKERI